MNGTTHQILVWLLHLPGLLFCATLAALAATPSKYEQQILDACKKGLEHHSEIKETAHCLRLKYSDFAKWVRAPKDR